MISLAWKNIWRNKTRSFILLIAIVIGVVSGTVFTAFYNGMIYQRLENAIANEISNLQIHSTTYLDSREITDTIPNLKILVSVLDSFSDIQYSTRLKSVAMINSTYSNTGVLILGVDPEREINTTQLWKTVVEGNFVNDSMPNGICIGKKLAEKLKIKLRSKVVVTFQDMQGNLTSAAYRIIGIYQSGNTAFDERMVFLHKKAFLNALGSDAFLAHEIAISLPDDNNTESLAAFLKAKFPDLGIKTWKQLYPEVGMMVDYTNYLQLIFMTIIYLALSFGIINTMLMAVMERTREIGMLMAIGMKNSRIFSLISCETILLMLSGTVIGLLISFILVQLLAITGINLTAYAKGFNQMGFSAIVYPSISTREYIQTMLLVFIAGFLSSIIPARKALKLSPAEALRKL